jgi:hypothetical protein
MAITVTRIANFYDDLEKTVKGFHPKAERLVEALGTSTQYGIYDDSAEPYLLIISKAKRDYHIIGEPNIVLTVTSDTLIKSLDIMRQFQEKSGIVLELAGKDRAKLMQNISSTFEVFKKVGPEKAMGVLKKR